MGDSKYDEALAAIKAIFEDTSVDKDTTISDLRGLREEINSLLDSLGK